MDPGRKFLGVASTRAHDWKIAYDDSDDIGGPRVVLAEIKFVLVSEVAQIMAVFELSGEGLKFGRPKIPERIEKVTDWLKKWEGIEREKIFWPLKVFQAFCVNDLDWADGTAKVGSWLSKKVLFFNAYQGNMDKNPGNLPNYVPRVLGNLFKQSNNDGQVLEDQPLDIGFLITKGTWRLHKMY